jgi:hypothetical protein
MTTREEIEKIIRESTRLAGDGISCITEINYGLFADKLESLFNERAGLFSEWTHEKNGSIIHLLKYGLTIMTYVIA